MVDAYRRLGFDDVGYTANRYSKYYFEITKERDIKQTVLTPTKIIYNGPATIVFWDDGTKTVVKRSKKDKDNKYNAFCAALAIKIYGSNSAVTRIVENGITEKPFKV